MPLFIEFADSEVAAVAQVGGQLHIRVAAASALRVDGNGSSTHGHVAAVEWVLQGAVVQGPLHELVGRIASGRAECAGRWATQLALPSVTAGPVRLELGFANRGTLTASGTALECRVDGTPRFSESLAC